jgi:hypothetical protein
MNDRKTCRKCFTVRHINDITNDRKSRDGLKKIVKNVVLNYIILGLRN